MRRPICFSSLIAICLTTLPYQADAQTLDSPPGLYTAVPATFSVFDSATLMQQRRAEKSPALAGILSWAVFPGVGSYYAGNSGHGTRHLVIGLGALTVTVVGLVQAVESIDQFGNISGGGFALAGVGLLAYMVNSIWSIVVAVNDAGAYNAGIASVIQPGVRILTLSSGMAPIVPKVDRRVGLQLVRISF